MILRLEKLSILLVEDLDPMKKLISSVLGTMGVGNIFTASDGEHGFNMFCNKNPDIVLTDWHMLPESGIDLAKKIRTHSRSPNKMVPIIMMTGYSAMPRVSEARDFGVTEFLVKPFSAADLSQRIVYTIQKPRDFVDASLYFGPDRRRRIIDSYAGKKRRKIDLETS